MSESKSALNVLLVCAGGITTSILARRVQQQLLLKGYADHVEASGIYEMENKAYAFHLILVAPQAGAFLDQIHAVADRLDIPVEMINEGALTGNDVQQTVDIIIRYHHKAVARKKNKPVEFNITTIKQIVFSSLQSFSAIFLVSLGVWILNALVDLNAVHWLNQVLMEMIGFYLIFSVGYHYAVTMKLSPLAGIILCIVCSFMLLPINNIGKEKTILFFRDNLSFIPLSAFRITMCPVLFLICLAAIFLDQKVRKWIPLAVDQDYFPLKFSNTIYTGLVISVFFLLRIGITALFR